MEASWRLHVGPWIWKSEHKDNRKFIKPEQLLFRSDTCRAIGLSQFHTWKLTHNAVQAIFCGLSLDWSTPEVLPRNPNFSEGRERICGSR